VKRRHELVNRSPSDDIECISPSAQRCELLHPRVASEQSDRHLEEWMIRACQAYTGRSRWKLVGVIGCSNWLLYESSFEGVACCLGSNEVRNSGFGASEHRSIEGKSRSGNTTEHPSTTYASINPYCCISYPNAVLLKKKVQKDRLRETERAVQRAILIGLAYIALHGLGIVSLVDHRGRIFVTIHSTHTFAKCETHSIKGLLTQTRSVSQRSRANAAHRSSFLPF